VVNADGTARTTIYEAPADGSYYNTGSDKWSPDGTRLVFDACGPDCFTSSVYVARADGTGRIELGHGAEQNFNPDWSPDGRRVAFQTSRNGVSRINIINADGTGRVELPGEEGYHGAPIWQPRKAGDTPAGANVLVVENAVAVNFSNVTTAGVTTVTPIDPNSLQGIPGEYVIGAGTLAFEIQTALRVEAVGWPPVAAARPPPQRPSAPAGSCRVMRQPRVARGGVITDRIAVERHRRNFC